jgi:hypothetical protein
VNTSSGFRGGNETREIHRMIGVFSSFQEVTLFARQSMLLKTGLSESVDMLLAVWLDEGSLAPGCMLLVRLVSTVKEKKLHIIG